MIRSVSPKMAQHVNKKIAQSGNWESVLRQYVTKLKSGFWDWDYVNSCFQLGYGDIDIYAAYCFAHFHTWVSIGKVLTAAIDLGLEPERDELIEENNKRLARLPGPFSGHFAGGNHSNDGYVKWSEPIEFGQIDCTGREVMAVIKPKSIPLEVGLTRPDTTIYHILGDHALARWPYSSERIHLFVRNPNWPKSAKD